MNTVRLFRNIGALNLVLLLAGCAGMNGDFGCNASTGDQCLSVSAVNTLARQGRTETTQKKSVDQKTISTLTYPLHMPLPGMPVRAGESIQRLWIAPYEATDHTFHEPGIVYFVKTPSHWNALPVRAIKGEDH